MKFKEWLLLTEIAQPTKELKSSTLYHGTPKKSGYQGILDHGLKFDSDLVAQKYKGQENFAPMHGVYLTKEFGNAVRYSFMSEVSDEQYQEYVNKEPLGYVFEFSGEDLSEVSPDEDELGGFLEKLVKTKNLTPNFKKLVDSIPQEIKTKLEQPEPSFESYAIAGKWAVNKLSDPTMQYLMKRYSNVVNYGTIKPNAVWIIPKPKERFLRDRQGTFNTFDGYLNHAKKYGKRHTL